MAGSVSVTAQASWPPSGLPEPVAMAGVVQPRGRSGFALRCLVCGEWFVSGRRDRRTCSDTCRRKDAATRRAANAAEDWGLVRSFRQQAAKLLADQPPAAPQ